MAGYLPPVIAFLLGNIEDFKLKMDEAQAKSAETDAKIAESGKLGKMAFMAVGAAVAGVAVESLKLATQFDATMTRINTQDNAGLTITQMKALKNSVIDLAGPTAQAPEALADAMIHVYGSGLKGAQALDLLKVAAEGATIGHANLTDVTNALDAAVAVGIKGTGDYSAAMGELNATVGAGDMTMQNLADALGGPMLATVKGYGLSITDVGAALAVFGDRNIRGADAATQLRMATQALAVPAAAPAAKLALEGIGLATTSLRDDLQKGGLQLALNDLREHLLAAGYSSTTAGAFITTAFGKKAGGGLNVLFDSLSSSTSNFNDKFKMVAASGQTFAADWAATQDTLAFKIKALGAGLEGLGVKIGTYLMPFVSQGIGQLEKFATAIGKALNSQAAGAAESTLKTIWSDVVRFVRDAATTVGEFEQALKPAATLLATVFLAGLEGVGKILADVVGPAIKWFGDRLKENAGVIRDGLIPVLFALGARLLYIKTLAAVDMFTAFVLGIGKAAAGIRDFTTAAASGAIFDSLKMKIGLASDAYRALTTSTDAAAAAATAGAAEQAAAALQTQLDGVMAGGAAGNMALLAASHSAVADSLGIEKAATEAATAKTSLLAAVSGLSAKEVTALGDASLAAAASEDTAAVATAGLGKAIASLTVIGAVIGGVGLLADELGKLSGVGDHTKQDMTALQSQLLDMGNGVAGTSTKVQGMAVQFAEAGRMMHQMDSGNPVAIQGMKDLDKATADLVSSGNPKAAAVAYGQMTAALQAQGFSLGYIHDQLFPQYNETLAKSAESNKAAAAAADEANASVGASVTPLSAAAQAAQDAADAIRNTADAFTTLSNDLKSSTDLLSFKKDLLDVTGTVKQNGTAFDENSLKGIANMQAFNSAAQGILKYRDSQITALTATEGGTQAVIDANKTSADQATQLLKVWGQVTGNSKAVDAYAKSIGLIPKDMSTQLSVKEQGFDDALNKLQQIRDRLDSVNGGPGTMGGQRRAAGGPITGPGGPTSDSVPVWASNGEYMISAAGVSSVPRALLDAINVGDMNRASAILGQSGIPSGGPSFGGGSFGGGDQAPVVNVYVQDPGTGAWRTAANTRVQVARYQQRNSRNNLTLPGYGT